MFDLYRAALAELGFEIFDVPVATFLSPDVTRVANLLADLKAFQPDLAFGLSKGSYALICRLPPRRDGWRPNLFTEVLDIPTICLWDHAPLELADQLLAPPTDPARSASAARETLRRILTHPRLIHWSPDTGQTRLMEELGFLLPSHVIQEPLPSLPGFLRDVPQGGAGDRRVGFIGHFYQSPAEYSHDALGALAQTVIREWLAGKSTPHWHLLADHVSRMDSDLRRRLALDPDQSYFWHFAHRLIAHRAQTAVRLEALGAAGVPIICYGNLKTDAPGVPPNLTAVSGNIPFGPELATTLAKHTITVDVFNPGSIHGYSHKPMMAFSAGGFMLVDRRRDFIQAFGDAGEAISYDRDLDAKIDRFLTNSRSLTEVRQAIREIIFSRYALRDVLTRVLNSAILCAEGARGRPAPPVQIIAAKNLLKKMRARREWSGASVKYKDGATVIVAPQQWGYAAEIRIPSSARKMQEPHLRLKLTVETGMIGVAAMLDRTEELIGEQVASASRHPIDIIVELPREGVSAVIVRNTAGMASRARVVEATLCDRVTRPA